MAIYELDQPLNFHGNSEIKPEPASPMNKPTIGVDMAVWEAMRLQQQDTGSFVKEHREQFGEFGSQGGAAARKYGKAMRENLHHQVEYAPCKTLDPEDYAKIK